jgi:hypothetical protein
MRPMPTLSANDGPGFHSDMPISKLAVVSSIPPVAETMDRVTHEIRPTPTKPNEARGDEDITPSDALADPPTIMQGPMTRARRRQLNLEVSSFLSDPFHTFENRLLPNDVILIRNIGEGHEELRGRGGGNDD